MTDYRTFCFRRLCLVVYVLNVLQTDVYFRAYRGGGAAEAVRASDLCPRIPGLSPAQARMCEARPDVVAAVGEGARLGAAECRRQFRHHRWNCSHIGSDRVFGHVLVVGSREAAFVYAAASAGATFVVAQACSRGNVSGCGCERGAPAPARPGAQWKWGGCSVDVRQGVRLSRRFVDAREVERDARSLMNLHNNQAGRKAVKHNLKTECKCHGVSGSCTMKTCWKTLPSFAQIGDYLMRAYRKSRRVAPAPGRRPTHLRPAASPRSGARGRSGRVRPRELVHLEDSPNYCEPDVARGSLGTAGRACNRTWPGEGGCEVLCCGRGYNTHQFLRAWQCNCKFHWCCYVNCDACRERTENYVCK